LDSLDKLQQELREDQIHIMMRQMLRLLYSIAEQIEAAKQTSIDELPMNLSLTVDPMAVDPTESATSTDPVESTESIAPITTPITTPIAPILKVEEVNVRVILAAYLMVLHPTEAFKETENQFSTTLAASAKAMLKTFLDIVLLLAKCTPPEQIAALLTLPTLITTYTNDFNVWEARDKQLISNRLTAALDALRLARATPEVATQTERLRAQLRQYAGEEGVRAYDAGRVDLPNLQMPNLQTEPLDTQIAHQLLAFPMMYNFIEKDNSWLAHELLLDPAFQMQDQAPDSTLFFDTVAAEMRDQENNKAALILRDIKNSTLYLLDSAFIPDGGVRASIMALLDVSLELLQVLFGLVVVVYFRA
jgi:hypothetical protein